MANFRNPIKSFRSRRTSCKKLFKVYWKNQNGDLTHDMEQNYCHKL